MTNKKYFKRKFISGDLARIKHNSRYTFDGDLRNTIVRIIEPKNHYAYNGMEYGYNVIHVDSGILYWVESRNLGYLIITDD